ncbi:NADH-quinone oxidoreductase subunit NuoK [candidate division KSB1 bacterium]|nr:NADH-quinone oxidoreductase subunit NuoK [candidate division KSB1 bacterium]
MQITLEHYLFLSAFLFAVGVAGVLTRRNALIIFMSIVLMLNGVNLTFIALAHYLSDMVGRVFVGLGVTVAAAEVAVGLAVVIAIFRNKGTVHIDVLSLTKW